MLAIVLFNSYHPCCYLYAKYLQLYTSKTHVCKVYKASAVLYLQFVLLVMLFRPLNMFLLFTVALSVACVQSPTWRFFVVP
jgi:hypothetical protein